MGNLVGMKHCVFNSTWNTKSEVVEAAMIKTALCISMMGYYPAPTDFYKSKQGHSPGSD
jgi:hypothetical protein